MIKLELGDRPSEANKVYLVGDETQKYEPWTDNFDKN